MVREKITYYITLQLKQEIIKEIKCMYFLMVHFKQI
jgi:hypothetical protein